MPDPARHLLTVDGLTIHARTQGAGPALLLHNGIFSPMDAWTPLLPHLPGYTVVTYDAPGIGASPPPRRPLSMRDLAAVGAGVLDQLGIGTAHVLGASFGGAVAQQMALTHPGRVNRLVLASTSYGGPLALPGRPSALLGLAARGDGTMPGLLASAYRVSALAGWTSMLWLHRIGHPTLVLCGDRDDVTPLFNHRVMAGRIPDSRLHVIEGQGHLMLLDAAHLAGPVITAFLGAEARTEAA